VSKELGAVLGGIAGTIVIVSIMVVLTDSQDQVRARERVICQEALKLGLQENTPGEGWTVVMRVPGKPEAQLLCRDPKTDREAKQVICMTQVVGVGDEQDVDFMRWALR
jgi:hypothetical protein